VRSAGVSGRFAFGFRTDLHFADVWQRILCVLPTLKNLSVRMRQGKKCTTLVIRKPYFEQYILYLVLGCGINKIWYE